MSGTPLVHEERKQYKYAGLAIAYLWRAVELSRDRWQSVACRTALGAAYRARKDPRISGTGCRPV